MHEANLHDQHHASERGSERAGVRAEWHKSNNCYIKISPKVQLDIL
jgi:hypothetical protein